MATWHRGRHLAWALAWALLAGCAPNTCDDSADRRLSHAVDVLASESGALADEARAHVTARGRSAIVFLEAAIYDAEADGRRRIVRALVDIGDPEVAPILRQLARVDEDAGVREAARRGLERLGAPAGRGSGRDKGVDGTPEN